MAPPPPPTTASVTSCCFCARPSFRPLPSPAHAPTRTHIKRPRQATNRSPVHPGPAAGERGAEGSQPRPPVARPPRPLYLRRRRDSAESERLPRGRGRAAEEPDDHGAGASPCREVVSRRPRVCSKTACGCCIRGATSPYSCPPSAPSFFCGKDVWPAKTRTACVYVCADVVLVLPLGMVLLGGRFKV